MAPTCVFLASKVEVMIKEPLHFLFYFLYSLLNPYPTQIKNAPKLVIISINTFSGLVTKAFTNNVPLLLKLLS